jgi:NAD(P)-dependent dehydrogenase (short-subunit alcohol dehydrogenase family)
VSNALQGKVAVVTGASRGIGKGAALALGELGATVYVTGRTVEPGKGLPGTVGETADQVTELGGRGVAVAVDHHDDAQVDALFDRITKDEGRLDVLVNNVYPSADLTAWLGKPFWELPVEAWDGIIDIGLRSHYVAARRAAMLMVPAKAGVIVNVSSSGSQTYSHNIPYGVGKAALDRFTEDAAHELRDHGVSVVSLWPGLVKTELVMAGASKSSDGSGRDVIALPNEGEIDLSGAQSPLFVGRAAAGLAADPHVLIRSGKAWPVADLAHDYGFTDEDGNIPDTRVRPDAE